MVATSTPTPRHLSMAKHVAREIQSTLRDDLNRANPIFKEFIMVSDGNGAEILFAVLDERKLGEPVHNYLNDAVVHQISTRLKGRPVAISNRSGARFAVLLKAPPKLPAQVEFPEQLERDQFYLGVSRDGPVKVGPDQLLNVLAGGATRWGKSNFLEGLAFSVIHCGYQLYLADPQSSTFSPIWNSVAAVPIASSTADFLALLDALRMTMQERSMLFNVVRKPNGMPVQKLTEYNRFAREALPRIFLLVDEANSYFDNHQVVNPLADIARGGLKYGVHTILAAHNWRAKDVPRSLSSHFATRLSFHVDDNTSGKVVLDSDSEGQRAMRIKSRGRYILRLAGEPFRVVQAYLAPEDRLAEILVNVHAGDGEGTTPLFDPLTEQEREVAEYVIENTKGKVTLAILTELGIGQGTARRMMSSWEQRDWVWKDLHQGNARFVTQILRGLTERIYA
jgi:hypothetical protein